MYQEKPTVPDLKKNKLNGQYSIIDPERKSYPPKRNSHEQDKIQEERSAGYVEQNNPNNS